MGVRCRGLFSSNRPRIFSAGSATWCSAFQLDDAEAFAERFGGKPLPTGCRR
jgi:hypothetical protein